LRNGSKTVTLSGMTQQWRRDVLPEIVAQLATRPGHEAVRVGLTRLIVDGLGRQVGGVDHEFRMPLIGGRADTLFASTVFELKSDLGRELPDVLAKLPDYLRERARLTGRPLGLGIATDGATFLAYELREDVLTQIGSAVHEVMGHGVTAGLVLGAKVPIILTSRADHDVSRLLSTAIAALVARSTTAARTAMATNVNQPRE
jgi:hypothetical protein